MSIQHARIDAEAFAALVQGKAVDLLASGGDHTVTVRLILADIGLAEMIRLVVEGARGPEEEPCILPPAAFR